MSPDRTSHSGDKQVLSWGGGSLNEDIQAIFSCGAAKRTVAGK